MNWARGPLAKRSERHAQDRLSSQRDRFIETARALGADEDETAFKEKLTVIARQKVKPATDPADDKP
jgi:hypothetical protein